MRGVRSAGPVRRIAAVAAILGAVVVGWLGAGPALAAGPLPVPRVAASASPAVVKYYVVRDPGAGQQEFLFDIAARTLGNGKRFREIFELNQGRLQPDGQRLSDPAILHPGWILQLPADARGPGVQTGPLPVFTGGLLSTPPVTAAAPPAESPAIPDAVSRAALLIVVVALLGLALRLLRRGRRLGIPPRLALAAAPANDDWGDDTWGDDTRGDGARREDARVEDVRVEDHHLVPAGDRPQRSVAPGPPTPRLGEARHHSTDTQPHSTDTQPRSAETRSAETRSAESRSPETSAAETRSAESRSRPAETHPAEAHGRPPANPASAPRHGAAEPLGPFVQATVSAGTDTVAVQLVGVRAAAGTPFAWHGRRDPRSATGTTVLIGDDETGPLLVDLALSPDVITVVGEPTGVLRLARSLARQLVEAHVPVVVVADLLGPVPASVTPVAALAELDDTPADQELRVLFAAPTQVDERLVVRRLLTAAEPRTVIVLVGDGPRARWSLHVVDAADE